MARCITAEAARERLSAALELIDSFVALLRDTPSDTVGNGFRVDVAERLETQQRALGGLSYRMFGELFEPPDGPDPTMVEDASLRDVLWARLRITPAEIRRHHPRGTIQHRTEIVRPPQLGFAGRDAHPHRQRQCPLRGHRRVDR